MALAIQYVLRTHADGSLWLPDIIEPYPMFYAYPSRNTESILTDKWNILCAQCAVKVFEQLIHHKTETMPMYAQEHRPGAAAICCECGYTIESWHSAKPGSDSNYESTPCPANRDCAYRGGHSSMDDNDKLIDNLYKLRQKLAEKGRVIGNIDVCERHLKMCIENGATRMDSARFADDHPLRQVYILMGLVMMCEPFERCAICSVE